MPDNIILTLKARGLVFDDEKKAENFLWNIGYFRFSAYLRPLYEEPKTAHRFKAGASFEQALSMYRFDRKLRLLIFNEIEKIEVSVRSAIINIISDGIGDVFWMTDPVNFSNQQDFANAKKVVDKEISRSKEAFICHFQEKYSEKYPPSWMIAEIIPLGALCAIFKNLKDKSLKKKVADVYGLKIPVFESWLHVIALLRNSCCHHARVWNKDMSITPQLPSYAKYSWLVDTGSNLKRVYIRLCIIRYFLFTVSPQSNFSVKIKELLKRYPSINVSAMGFPKEWESEPLWK